MQERFASASTTTRQALQKLRQPIDITKADAKQQSCDFRPQVQVIRYLSLYMNKEREQSCHTDPKCTLSKFPGAVK